MVQDRPAVAAFAAAVDAISRLVLSTCSALLRVPIIGTVLRPRQRPRASDLLKPNASLVGLVYIPHKMMELNKIVGLEEDREFAPVKLEFCVHYP